jgi:hypothetical protein
MKNVPLLDELLGIRQRLAREQNLDVEKYAEMLRQIAQTLPGDYVAHPLLPAIEPPQSPDSGHTG